MADRSRRRARPGTLASAAVLALAACNPDSSPTGPSVEVETLAVDTDRNACVFDTQAKHVRVFDATGTYLSTFGREGEGPGEFAGAETVAVLPDGRLRVRDPGNMRVQVFDPVSGGTEEWPYNSGNHYRPGAALPTDVRGRTFVLKGVIP